MSDYLFGKICPLLLAFSGRQLIQIISDRQAGSCIRVSRVEMSNVEVQTVSRPNGILTVCERERTCSTHPLHAYPYLVRPPYFRVVALVSYLRCTRTAIERI
jgi:hypothetical protein